jgi:hypothetical protein
MSLQNRIKLIKMYLSHPYIFRTEIYIMRILIILAVLIFLLTLCNSCAVNHGVKPFHSERQVSKSGIYCKVHRLKL